MVHCGTFSKTPGVPKSRAVPTYVYACSQCEQTFEQEQRITDAPLTRCICGKDGSVKRVMQPVGIAFNGSGFYVNDAASASCSKGDACACKPPSA